MEMGLSECLWMKDVWLYACIYCTVKRKINAKRVAYGHQTFKKYMHVCKWFRNGKVHWWKVHEDTKHSQEWWLSIFIQEDNYLLDSFKDVRKSDVYVWAVELKCSPQKQKLGIFFSWIFSPSLCRNSDIASKVKFQNRTQKFKAKKYQIPNTFVHVENPR